MNLLPGICVGLLTLAAMPLWSQANNDGQTGSMQTGSGSAESSSTTSAPDSTDSRMQSPPPVSGQPYAMTFTSEERSNYLRGGVAFTTAHTDNAVGAIAGSPISDISYSVAPTLALDETTSRMHWVLSYAPGFTFYQKTSSRNEADQNGAIDFSYRLSPHVTFSARDSVQKSSNVFNQPGVGSLGTVSGSTDGANFSVIAPIADRLSNFGNVGLAYQFSRNSMVGVSGVFSNLHYPNPAEVPGLYDSSSQGGSAFYTLRVSKANYLGATYQYQRLVSYLPEGSSETQTHSAVFFYTFFPASWFSISFFGGPQYSDTLPPAQPPQQPQSSATKSWTPAGGASLGWQSRLTSLAVSYAHIISGGGGLVGAVHLDTASASLRQRLTKTLNASLSGVYAQNNIIGGSTTNSNNGHSVSGTATLEQQFGQHLRLQMGYTRIHQTYGGVAVLASTPDTNREFVELSFQFSKPLGR